VKFLKADKIEKELCCRNSRFDNRKVFLM